MPASSTPGSRRSASAWHSAAKPVPITPTRRRLLVRSMSLTGGKRDGEDDDHAAHDLLLAELEAEDQQAVVDQADHEGADQGADHGAAAAEQARATEDHRRDDRQLVPLAPLEATRLQAPRVEHPRQGGDHAGDEQHRELDPPRGYAAEARGLLVAAGGEHVAPIRRLA